MADREVPLFLLDRRLMTAYSSTMGHLASGYQDLWACLGIFKPWQVQSFHTDHYYDTITHSNAPSPNSTATSQHGFSTLLTRNLYLQLRDASERALHRSEPNPMSVTAKAYAASCTPVYSPLRTLPAQRNTPTPHVAYLSYCTSITSTIR